MDNHRIQEPVTPFQVLPPINSKEISESNALREYSSEDSPFKKELDAASKEPYAKDSTQPSDSQDSEADEVDETKAATVDTSGKEQPEETAEVIDDDEPAKQTASAALTVGADTTSHENIEIDPIELLKLNSIKAATQPNLNTAEVLADSSTTVTLQPDLENLELAEVVVQASAAPLPITEPSSALKVKLLGKKSASLASISEGAAVLRDKEKGEGKPGSAVLDATAPLNLKATTNVDGKLEDINPSLVDEGKEKLAAALTDKNDLTKAKVDLPPKQYSQLLAAEKAAVTDLDEIALEELGEVDGLDSASNALLAKGDSSSLSADASKANSTTTSVEMQTKIHTSFHKPQWAEAFSQRFMWMVNQDASKVLVQLDPSELGPMEVKMQVNKDATVNVVFTSHSASVREVLESQIARLRESLEDSGLTLGDVDVSSGEQDDTEDTEDESADSAGSNSSKDSADADFESEESVTMANGLVDTFA